MNDFLGGAAFGGGGDGGGGGVTPRLARRTWRSMEAAHAMIYFSPAAVTRYRALGLSRRAGYFASRSAALGAVPADVVIATFYNFNPALVRSVIPAAWQATSPAAVLAARLGAVDATLRELLGDAVDSAAMSRAASLARRAAEAVAHDLPGRPLYAAHAALPWPERPHLVLWHAQTLLREYRGDGHIAALLAEGLTGIEALITHAASGAMSADALRTTRAWPETDWAAAIGRLRDRGWLTAGPEPVFTADGKLARQRIEDTTDRLAMAPYVALGEAGCAELRALAGPLAGPLIDALLPWARDLE